VSEQTAGQRTFGPWLVESGSLAWDQVDERSTVSGRGPVPRCPIRPGDACSLCEPGVAGPEDCGLVYLVMNDPDLRSELDRIRQEQRTTRRLAVG
jgi:hypothetical protein